MKASLAKAPRLEICTGLLSNIEGFIEHLRAFGPRIAVIADDVIAGLYGKHLEEKLSESGFEVLLLTFPSGEEHKIRSTKERLEDSLLERGFGRDTSLIAIGGGVSTDLAGYIAATYCRGIPLIMIPTSLLGMVDACIGGKTGVNVPAGKNMIGAIYHPEKILIDPTFLQSLPLRELKNGIVEMIKHGLIADENHFDFLEKHSRELLALKAPYLEKAIWESILIKKAIAEKDEREVGPRFLLNFGHTVGHALEVVTAFKMPHGEAVAIGIVAESHLSLQLGHLSKNSYERIHEIFASYEIPLEILALSPADVYLAMKLDKKAVENRPRFALLKGIGRPYVEGDDYCIHVDERLVRETLNWMCHALRRR